MKTIFTGQIVLWNTAFGAVPNGWQICNGTNGTPDLRDQFVVGAGDTYAPDDSGGDVDHNHTFTSDGHNHSYSPGSDIAGGVGFVIFNSVETDSGTTAAENHLPPYYAVTYIMKL